MNFDSIIALRKNSQVDDAVITAKVNDIVTEKVNDIVTEKVNDIVTVNVKSFGAKGDGIADDTNAINNAISSIVNGGTILFPIGTYLCSGVLNFNKNNVRILGDNAILKCTTKQYFVHLKGKNIIIENMTIDGNSIVQVGLQVDDNSENIKIINCEVHHCGNLSESSWIYGIQVSANACKNVIIDKCYIHNIYTKPNGTTGDSYGMDKGIMIGATAGSTGECSKYITIQNCRFEYIGGVEDGSAIAIYGLTASTPDIDTCHFYITIKDNYFNYCEKSFIKVMPCSYVNIEGNHMINPYITDADAMYSAIGLYGANMTFTNNKVYGGTFALGVEIGTDNVNDIKINNNTIICTNGVVSVRTIATKGIFLVGTGTMNNILIANNYIEGQNYGIFNQNQQIKGLTIINNTINSTGAVGIGIYDYCMNLIINNNITINQTHDGIILDKWALSSATITNAIIQGNSMNQAGWGITLNYGSNISVCNNNSSGGWGIVNYSATNVTTLNSFNNVLAGGFEIVNTTRGSNLLADIRFNKGKSVILISPNGTQYKVRVSDTGTLSASTELSNLA